MECSAHEVYSASKSLSTQNNQSCGKNVRCSLDAYTLTAKDVRNIIINRIADAIMAVKEVKLITVFGRYT